VSKNECIAVPAFIDHEMGDSGKLDNQTVISTKNSKAEKINTPEITKVEIVLP
jgi:hypothetical protein